MLSMAFPAPQASGGPELLAPAMAFVGHEVPHVLLPRLGVLQGAMATSEVELELTLIVAGTRIQVLTTKPRGLEFL